jgi:hypothetical protein
MPFRDTAREYKRAAGRRFDDANELMQMPTWDSQRSDAKERHLRGAMYLAGYAVECLLKAYLIHQMNAQTLGEATAALDVQRISRGLRPLRNILRTAAGHQIAYLIQLTDLPKIYPSYDPKLWGRLGEWQSAWRYESDAVARAEAEAFLNDVQAVVDWLSSKM